jgi:hypothetical protein
MPNGDDIFMHDTPDRHLFRRPDRAFSSGCIRLERPNELMAVLLDGTPGWDMARAQRALDARVTSAVSLRPRAAGDARLPDGDGGGRAGACACGPTSTGWTRPMRGRCREPRAADRLLAGRG